MSETWSTLDWIIFSNFSSQVSQPDTGRLVTNVATNKWVVLMSHDYDLFIFYYSFIIIYYNLLLFVKIYYNLLLFVKIYYNLLLFVKIYYYLL